MTRIHGVAPRSEHFKGRKVCAGTYNSGCRCDGCTEAFRAKSAEYRARRVAIAALGHPEGVPVSMSTYRNWGCRCDGCRKAKLDYDQSINYRPQAQWRARQRAARKAGAA